MKLVENKNGLRIITPESPDYVIYSIERNEYHNIVYLGKNDSVDNYREIEKQLLEQADEGKKMQDLLDKIERQDALISKLVDQINELSNLVKKK